MGGKARFTGRCPQYTNAPCSSQSPEKTGLGAAEPQPCQLISGDGTVVPGFGTTGVDDRLLVALSRDEHNVARVRLAEAAALGALGWFLFTTQAHENHLVFALPLLALAWPSRPSLLVVFGVLSVTVLLNMLLQDQLVLEALGSGLYSPIVMRLRSANAVLNVVTLAAWAGWAASRQPGTAPTGRVSRPVSIGEA